MKIPVLMALATDLNVGLVSDLRTGAWSCLAKVEASHLRTSSGTASDWSSERSSSVSSLENAGKGKKRERMVRIEASA